MSDEKYEIDIDVNATSGTKAFRELEKAEAAVRKEADKLTAAMLKQQRATETAARKAASAAKSQQAQIERVGRAQIAYANSVTKLGGAYGQDTRALQQKVAAQKAAEAATRALDAAEKKHYQTLSNTRYALYDASQAYLTLAGGLLAPAAAAITFNTQFDKAFSSVRRTTLETGASLQELRDDLVSLSTSMPTKFDALSQIATIGAQLNVATDDLEGFTELVAMFSATTNVSVEETAKGLGRLAQLTHTAGYEYANLGSAIYQVGITSVATEKEILDMASEIATSGDLAGFANHQIIALAGSLASLGVQPEAARGSLMRIFNVIEQGATGGGEKLAELARISNMSAEQFKTTWGTDSQAVFTAFVEGLSQMQEAGANTNATLKGLGINAIRDIRTLQILANNTEVYAQALNESATAYQSGSALTEGFAIQMENLADKLTMLGNTLAAIGDAVGSAFGPGLMELADAATSVAKAFLAIVNNPIGKFFAAVAVGLAAAAGAALAYQGAMMLVKASIAALTVSVQGIRSNADLLSGGLRRMAGEFVNVARAMNGTTVAARSTGTALEGVAAQSYVAQRSLGTTAFGARAAQAALTGFRATLMTLGVGLALAAIPEIINQISYALSSGADKARSYFGEFDSLTGAIEKDTKAWKESGDAIHTISGTVTSATGVTKTYSDVLADAGTNQGTLGANTDTATNAIKNQTIALGENAKAAYANELANNKDFSAAYTSARQELKALGFDMNKYLDESLKGTSSAYIAQFKQQAESLRNAAEMASVGAGSTRTQAENEQIKKYNTLVGLLDNMSNAAQLLDEKSRALASSQLIAADAGIKLADSLGDESEEGGNAAGKMSEIVSTHMAVANATLSANTALTDFGTTLGTNGAIFDVYSATGQENLDALKSSLSSLAETAGDDSATFAANVVGMVATIQEGGGVVSGELSYLTEILNEAVGQKWGLDFSTAQARTDIAAFIASAVAAAEAAVATAKTAAAATAMVGGYAASVNNAALVAAEANLTQIRALQDAATKAATTSTSALSTAHEKQAASANKANKASKNLTKTVRTMSDYMNDLESVVSKAFDFRFGLDKASRDLKDAQDDIKATVVSFQSYMSSANLGDSTAAQIVSMSASYVTASDEIADAVQKILDAQASLSENVADKKVAEYQLGVAIQYGDELRAAKLRAKIADLDAENVKLTRSLAGAQNDLSEAQSNSANSASEQMETLTEKWQDYILELVNSGASSKEVAAAMKNAKTDIANLGTQLGMGTTQVAKYVSAIGDIKKAIDKIPKKLTVGASTDPAKRALDEFLASKTVSSLKSGISVPVSAAVDKESLAKAARGQKLLADISEAFAQAAKAVTTGDFNTAAKWRAKGLALQAKLIKGNYQVGGFTGHGAANEPAGIVHRGEFVIPKPMVNQSTGLPYADALGRIMRGYQGGGYVTAPTKAASASVTIVELSPTDRALLAAVGNVSIAVDGKVLATTVNKANKNSSIRGQG